MIFVSRQTDLPTPERDERSRRRMVILCIVLMVAGVVATGLFLATDFNRLTNGKNEAVASLLGAVEDQREADAALERAVASDDGTQIPALTTAKTEADAQVTAITAAAEDHTARFYRGLARLGGCLAAIAILATFLVLARRRFRTHVEVTNATSLMIVLTGVALLASRLVLQTALTNTAIWGLVDLIVIHLAVAAIMPWSPRETALPFVPLLLLWVVTFLLPTASELAMVDRVVIVIMSPLILLPGALLAQWRRQRRREEAERKMLGARVEHLGGELSRARIVHDAMFPPEVEGHVRFEYEYQPIQEIGGDYVHLHVCNQTECTTLTLLDVAGHGLAAALTVNRLFGELERILAEINGAEPKQIMALLNRYINLTMARHSLYATGMCLSLDPNDGRLVWVNAGHPPCLLRRADGTVTEMPTTALILGAMESPDFDPGQRETQLRPGDAIIAYTDGAFEARDAQGHQFGLSRVRETACFDPPPRNWPKFIANAVADHHGGHAEDDVLIAALTLNSLRVGPAASPVIESRVRSGTTPVPATTARGS